VIIEAYPKARKNMAMDLPDVNQDAAKDFR